MTFNEFTHPDVEQVLRRLKDFQRDTVDYVFRRLYTDPDPVSRFLIADEVGLGKTLVARGVTARAVDYLCETQPDDHRIDVVYVCSNQAIAQQNINRLNIAADRQFQFASRLTLLPVMVQALQSNKLNFVSLTPGTSFNLRSQGGRWKERAVLYALLRQHWDVPDGTLRNVLRGGVNKENWPSYLEGFARRHEAGLDDEIVEAFYTALDRAPRLRAQYDAVADKIGPRRIYLNKKMRWERDAFIGELRKMLARASIASLEPDLVILDEFQQFKYLLQDEGEIALLAREMFDFPGAKVLLLSATPYKMYTLPEEEKDDHYTDFLDTAEFLLGQQSGTFNKLESAINRYRETMLRLGRVPCRQLYAAKTEIETILRRVMVRTERLAVSADRNGMLEEVVVAQDQVRPQDLLAFVHLDRVADELEAGDQVEYWKSASYPLNLMDDYKLKRQFSAALEEESNTRLTELLKQARDHLLSWDEIQEYQALDPGNARLRALWQDAVETGNWRLLWMPAALPYYRAAGPFLDVYPKGCTKTLVFSAWRLVPKCIAMLLSYEAERRMLELQERDFAYAELTDKRRPLLTFTFSQDRLTGMPVFCLIYPCLTLARAVDPLRIATRLGNGDLPSQQEVFERIKAQVEVLLQQAVASVEISEEGRADESWYWAALPLLDRHFSRRPVEDWLLTENEEMAWGMMVEGESGSGRFGEHVQQFTDFFTRLPPLGPPPDDLLDVLTSIALAGPAVASLRAFLRIAAPDQNAQWPEILSSVARMAMGFRTLFNQPETTALLQALYPDDPYGPYWAKVLAYSLDGNLQAVLDEYFHVLHESLGLMEHDADESAIKMGEAVSMALSIRAVPLQFDEITLDDDDALQLKKQRLRCRYALRFGDERSWDSEERTRDVDVRVAFNSPFRPFVLATTSIGQEGLDFHQYCHRVVHWNLPSNPVDLEQREGRVHRYKGHVIRRNLALNYGLEALMAGEALVDPWQQLFARAIQDRPAQANDLIPFWIYEPNGKAAPSFKIERRVPVLPMSRELNRIERLKRSLVVYRSVIGQPRQQELMEFLASHLDEHQIQKLVNEITIDLSPP